MNRYKAYTLVIVFAITLFGISLSSCKNNIKEIETLTKRDTLPTQSAFDVRLLYSERGIVRYIVESPQVDQYETSDPYVEFPHGMKVHFYDSLGNVTSELTAGYGIKYDKKRMMEAKYDVVVISHVKDEVINTEHMIWDQNEKKIFTNEFVTIKTKDKVIYGDALVSDEKFEKWEITRSKGNIKVQDEDE